MPKIGVMCLILLLTAATLAYGLPEFSVSTDTVGYDPSAVYDADGWAASGVYNSDLSDSTNGIQWTSDQLGVTQNDQIDGLSELNDYIPLVSTHTVLITIDGVKNIPTVQRLEPFYLGFTVKCTDVGLPGTAVNNEYLAHPTYYNRVGGNAFLALVAAGIAGDPAHHPTVPNGNNTMMWQHGKMGLNIDDTMNSIAHGNQQVFNVQTDPEDPGSTFQFAPGTLFSVGIPAIGADGSGVQAMARYQQGAIWYGDPANSTNWMFASADELGLYSTSRASDNLLDFIFWVNPKYLADPINGFYAQIYNNLQNNGNTTPLITPEMAQANHDAWIATGVPNFAVVFTIGVGAKGKAGSGLGAMDDKGTGGYTFFSLLNGTNYLFTSPYEVGLTSGDQILGLDSSTIPEPPTFILFGLALAGFAWVVRNKIRH